MFADRIRRAEGLALTSYSAEDGPYERALISLVVREDGGVRLTCGRSVDFFPQQGFTNEPQPAVNPIIVLRLTYSLVAFAGQLADEHTAYQGQWRLGIRMDRLLGAVPIDYLRSVLDRVTFARPGNPYSQAVYERVTTASTEELINAPDAVVERLVAPLLRGLGVASLYLPMKR